jgi:hypothetical protein
LDYNKFVEELSEINTAINTIEKILKYSGFSALTEESSLDVLSKIKSGIGYQLHNEMKTYFSETKNLLPDCQKILLSSDIIESGFGKYKNYVSLNPMAGVTNLILCISAFTASLEKSEIKKALESVTINDIKNWTKEFVGKTLLQKRRAVLNN